MQLVAHIDVHAGTAGIAYPWAYTTSPVANKALYDELANLMADEAAAVNGFDYQTGPLSVVYYVHTGTLTDWAHSQGLYAFTWELSPENGSQDVAASWIKPVGDELTPALLALAEYFIPEEPADPVCRVLENFEGTNPGWINATESTCTTGAFVKSTPRETWHDYRGALTKLQPAGDHTTGAGSAWYTAKNPVNAWTDDTDGGVCISESPVWNIPNPSTVSLWLFHGQRDANPSQVSDDYVRIEASYDNGVSWETVWSEGNIRSMANWKKINFSVSAGSELKLRLHSADNIAPSGDLVEFGIDDITVCEN
jgi:hypothetical protein